MNRSTARRMTMALLVSGGLSMAGFGLVAGTAQAEPAVTIVPEAAAQTVVAVVSQNTGFQPTDVTCPSGVAAKVGQRFECQFTGPEGPYTAYLEITTVDGQYVEYAIATRRD